MKNLDTNSKIKLSKENFIENTEKYNIIIDHAYDCTLVDEDGKEIVDFLSGIGVNSLGYSNENFKNGLKEQIDKVMHCSNYFYTEPKIQLSKLLIENSFADKVYFTNSGAEAVEGALKTVRKYCFESDKDEEKAEIVSMTKSFHGRTKTAINMTDKTEFKDGYGKAEDGYVLVKYNNCEALKAAVNENTIAIILEIVQGEGGLTIVSEEFLKLARELADKYNAILIFDEIQTGIGRTGKLFAYEHFGVTPDIMTLAKALGNGFPISAVLMTDKIAKYIDSDHSSTYGGNPLAMRAGVLVLTEMLEKDIPSLAMETGRYFKDELLKLKDEFEIIKDVKGLGLMLGIELEEKCDDYVEKLVEKGFLTNCTQENIIRFLPPLVIKKSEIDSLIAALKETLK